MAISVLTAFSAREKAGHRMMTNRATVPAFGRASFCRARGAIARLTVTPLSPTGRSIVLISIILIRLVIANCLYVKKCWLVDLDWIGTMTFFDLIVNFSEIDLYCCYFEIYWIDLYLDLFAAFHGQQMKLIPHQILLLL